MKSNNSSLQKLARYLRALPLALLLITTNGVYAQTNESKKEITSLQDPQKKEEKKSDEIYIVVDKQPEFPDGIAGLMEWLSANVQYPKEAHEKGIQGRVIVSFIIEKDGGVTDVQVIRGVDPLLDAEATRVIPLMPVWKPGELNNEPVRVKFTLPIVFRLSDEEKEARDSIPIRNSDTVKHETQEPSLVIIDDVIMEKGYKLNAISPADIDSISVLKGEDALSLYGEDGKDGVVIIRTKKASGINQDMDNVKVVGYRAMKDGTITSLAEKFGDDKPLLIIDDVVMGRNMDLKEIDADQIESVTVLKNESAISIYGEEGKSGAILIKTKPSYKAKKPVAKTQDNTTIH